MQDFKEIIRKKEIDKLSIRDLELITENYPYFQFAKSLLLKKYRDSEHFKYNNALKNIAAHTINREILFSYVNQLEQKNTQTKTLEQSANKKETFLTSHIEKEIEKPLVFTSGEKHSFKEWLKIKQVKPIIRESAQNKPLQTKLNTINQFLQNNPKISPLKKNVAKDLSVEKSIEDNSDRLMTETLAKVYTAQKKYTDAIQAYKILSLKYPEKSTFFADQILRIEILQKNKS